MKETGIKYIGEIEFLDIKVKIYNDQYTDENMIQCSWGMRNPDSCYTGIAYMNWETGKLTYPEGAIITEQTKKDREILPRFIITGKSEINEKLIKRINEYLDSDYKIRNK